MPRKGWAGVRNGELLRRAATEFDVFVTVDQNLQHQQNLGRFSGRRRRPRCPRQPNRNPGTSRPSPSERPSIAPGGPGHRNHSVASAIAFTRCACSPHQLIASNRRPRNPPIARFGPCAKAPCSRPTVSAHERTTRQSCGEVPGAGFPAGLTPRSVVLFPERPADGRWGSGFTARVAWRPTFATMMHRPCDASRCFQTDRFGQRGSMTRRW